MNYDEALAFVLDAHETVSFYVEELNLKTDFDDAEQKDA